MGQFKKCILRILSVVCLTCLVFGITACKQNSNTKDNRDKNILAVYDIYVAYAKENGSTPLSYEEWLESIKGKDGTNGVDGKSAYQIWLDNGHTGTETDFLNWLKGKDGTDGVDGKDGNGIKSAVINNKGELIITLDDGTIINAGQVVSPEKRIDENNKIICKTFEKTDKTIYGKVSNDTEIFYFTDEIEFVGNASYAVYRDFECTNEIISKTVKLAVGDNVFYLIEKCGNDTKFYTVTVRRREIYSVTFAVNDGTLLENSTLNIEEDSLISKDSIPSSPRDGYDLVWDYDFTKPITQNTEITATMTAIYIISGNTIKGLTDYGKTLSVLNIPSEIDGNKLTSIGDRAFSENNLLTSVTISNGITKIGKYTFDGCTSLKSITLPEGLTSIGEDTFDWCGSLTNINIPESVTSIGYRSFYMCTSLKSVVLHDGLTSIGALAFYECGSLSNITIPQSVTYIGMSAFYKCSSLTSITIPNGVTSISENVFSGCTSLTSIVLPEGLTSIGNSAFEDCTSLTNITIPKSVTSIGNSAFDGCTSLIDITIPESVTNIGTSAFSRCSSLTNVNLPNGLTNIASYMFYECTSLTNISIPQSVISIGNYAFRFCRSLTSITIPQSVTTIGNLAFGECNLLTSITISESVTDIANDAFNGCGSLKEVVFESPENWVAKSGNTVVKSFTAEELSNATTAASLLKRYSSYSWKKEN